jgi:hypothetical protein
MGNLNNQMNQIKQRIQQVGPQNVINQLLNNNPQLMQKYNALMQMNSGMSPTQIAIQMLQERGVDPSFIFGR